LNYPRSIIRTLNFFTQIFPNSNILVIQEFRVSRYQVLVSFQCLLYLIFIPLLINILAYFCFAPLTEYIWNTEQEDIFLNSYLEKKPCLNYKILSSNFISIIFLVQLYMTTHFKLDNKILNCRFSVNSK
jgi:hypothetical protein